MPTTAHMVAPSRCPHCGRPLPPAVAPRVLAAARALRTLPAGRGTTGEVAAALSLSRRQTSDLLARAVRAGLVAHVGSTPARGHGGAPQKVFAATGMIEAYEQ